MNVALLDLNFFSITGESPYLIHMQAGLKKLGINSEIVASSPGGRKLKYQVDYPITRLKDKNLAGYLERFDLIHFNNGRYNEKTYEFLDRLDPKIPRTLLVHGVTQSKPYNLPFLINKIKPKALFNVDPIGVEDYKQYGVPVYLVELPFDQDIMPMIQKIPTEKRIVVPSRFTFIKYPGEVLEIYKKLESLGFVIDFYGYEGFVANAQNCREAFEYLQKSGKVRLNPMFQFQQKAEIYNGAMLVFDGTRIKGMGANRIQYTTLESMFYGITPIIHKEWHHQYVSAGSFDFNLISELIENESLRLQMKLNNYKSLSHYEASKVCQIYQSVWFGK